MQNETPQILAERLDKLMDKEGLSNTALAKAVNTTKQTIGRYRNGDNLISVALLIDIADVLHVSTDYLLGRSDVATSNMEVQGVCKYTGLTEEAVQELADLKGTSASGMLSKVIQTKEFRYMVYSLAACEMAAESYLYPPYRLDSRSNQADYVGIANEYKAKVDEATQHTYCVTSIADQFVLEKKQVEDCASRLLYAVTEAEEAEKKRFEEAHTFDYKLLEEGE